MSHQPRTQDVISGIYLSNIKSHQFSIQKLKQQKKVLSILRLITVLCGIATSWFFWPASPLVFAAILTFSIILIFLVFRDSDKTSELQNQERLIRVNQHELDAIQQNLGEYDNGQNFADPIHAYAADMDLFGPSSLYQYLSRCHAEQSKNLLADYLKAPLSVAAIKEKQKAAAALSEKQSYCQRIQSTAMMKPLTVRTEKKIKRCMEAPSAGYEHRFWKWFQNIYPALPISILAMYQLDDISKRVFLSCLIGFYLISLLISRKTGSALKMLLDIEPEMDALRKQFLLIENEKFNSGFLQSLQKRLKPDGFSSASATIGEFNHILKKNDWKSNLLINLILQLVFLWDLRLTILLNDWKKKNKLRFSDWLAVIAEMEVTVSLASLVHNEPAWCFPDVDENYFHFQGKEIGHPLIPAAKRIVNDFELEGTGKIALITGSNMAGKSTFLRSLGINTVLAGMGSPVCAGQMKLSEIKLLSSMRVADNLSENTSTFYAELKKLKYIIDLVNLKEPVFILLDEVLRGTNSTDRHKGSQALVRQLLQSKAVAVMATHDTDLAHSESANNSVTNFHFEGKILAEELFFDYKIKNGICESLNATTLMKKIGIHFQE